MKFLRIKPTAVWVFAVISLLLFYGALRAEQKLGKELLANGDFEQVKNNQAAYWKSTGAIKPEQVSGVWRRYTVRFNSNKYPEVNFYFHVSKGSTGSLWIDNVTCSSAQIKNAGFEEQGPGGRPGEWNVATYWNTSLFSDSGRASDGQKSIRITHKDEAVPMTRLHQQISVKPNQEYAISYDIFVGDDFQGDAVGYVYEKNGISHLTSNYYEMFVAEQVATRDRCDKYVSVLTPTATAPAEISQVIDAKPGMNLQAGADINNKAFHGTARFIVEDALSGKILKESSIKDVKDEWQSLRFSFQSVSPRLRIRVSAEGSGSLRMDNVDITPPRITPPLQQVHWLPVTENFPLPAQLEVSIQGQTGKAIDGGLELLSKDLKKYNAALVKTESGQAPLKIIIAAANEVKGKGPESYSLTVNKKGITIKAGAEPGAFYGLMTLLQLMEEREGKPLILACKIADYPDMPLRGVLYGDAEQAARWKMNTVVVSTGYPVTPVEKQSLHDLVQKYQNLNLQFIPYFLTMGGGYYVQGINPNLAAGIWVKDEKVTLRGTELSPLANPYVIRTKLTDVKLKSADGAKEYKMGVDYQVIDGEMALWYDNPKAKPFTIVRLANSSIPDGVTVLASYDWVSHVRNSRNDKHIAYVPLEPETRRLMDDYLRNMARDYPFAYIHTSNDFHEFFPNDHQLATDSRVITSGKKPIELYAEDVSFQSAAIKQGNPNARIFQWTGSMDNPYVRAGEPFLPRDAHINIWGYDAGWPVAYGRDAVEYWSNLGFETSVLPWNNLRNVRGWAQVVAEARQKGYPCLGIIDSCWSGVPNTTGGMEETAIVSWKIPRAGERGFVSLSKPGDVKTQK